MMCGEPTPGPGIGDIPIKPNGTNKTCCGMYTEVRGSAASLPTDVSNGRRTFVEGKFHPVRKMTA